MQPKLVTRKPTKNCVEHFDRIHRLDFRVPHCPSPPALAPSVNRKKKT